MADGVARINWYRSPIDREVLAALTRKNDWRPLLQNVGMLAFSAATGALALWAYRTLPWPWVVVAVYFHCSFYGFFGGGAGDHELSHRSMFRTPALNGLFIRVSSFLTWFNFIHFRRSHAGHHQYTVHHDLDLEVMLPVDLKWYQWLWAFTISLPAMRHIFAMFFRHAFGRTREGMLKTEWERRIFPPEDQMELRRLRRWARTVLIGHTLLAAAFIATGNWILIILVTFAPFIATWFVMLTHMPQHIGMQPDVADWRRSTRTYLAGPVVRFFYWNMNYHVEHHMFAAVPFYNLPKLRAAIASDLPIASKGLLSTWREIARTVKTQKVDPSYHFTPTYPAATGGAPPSSSRGRR